MLATFYSPSFEIFIVSVSLGLLTLFAIVICALIALFGDHANRPKFYNIIKKLCLALIVIFVIGFGSCFVVETF